MPKGRVAQTTGVKYCDSLCPCGFQIQTSNLKLLQLKQSLHKKYCKEGREAQDSLSEGIRCLPHENKEKLIKQNDDLVSPYLD